MVFDVRGPGEYGEVRREQLARDADAVRFGGLGPRNPRCSSRLGRGRMSVTTLGIGVVQMKV